MIHNISKKNWPQDSKKGWLKALFSPIEFSDSFSVRILIRIVLKEPKSTWKAPWMIPDSVNFLAVILASSNGKRFQWYRFTKNSIYFPLIFENSRNNWFDEFLVDFAKKKSELLSCHFTEKLFDEIRRFWYFCPFFLDLFHEKCWFDEIFWVSLLILYSFQERVTS